MDLFLYNYSDQNYPFKSDTDISEVKSLFEGVSLLAAGVVYLTAVQASPDMFSGVFENYDGSPLGCFSGAFSDPLSVVSPAGDVVGFVYPGAVPSGIVRWGGQAEVSPLCISPTGDTEGSLDYSFSGYLQATIVDEVAEVEVKPEFASDQSLDSRGWDTNGSLLYLNGVGSPIGSLTLTLPTALGSFSIGAKAIILNTPEAPNFKCSGEYMVRDTSIQKSGVAGSAEPLPLDPVIDAEWRL